MSDSAIYTALNVPTVIPHPSVNCLQWSSDGQACLVTKTAVYILTPDPGINFDTTSVLRAPVGREKSNPLGWFRTMIEFNKETNKEKEKPQSWPEISQEWGAVTLGSLDVSVRGVTCSPSNVTVDAGCVLAAVNSNMEVSLWSASKNHLKGEWLKIFNITSFLIELFESQNLSANEIALQAQITSISWSPQADFGIAPAPCIDGSLLVAGNRAGSLILFRYHADAGLNEAVRHIMTIKVSDKWVTHIAWTSWTTIHAGKCEAYLACATSDGGICLVKIMQSLRANPSVASFEAEYIVETVSEVHPVQPFAADKRSITALTWVEAPGRSPILVYGKPGVILLWALPTLNVGWTGSRVLVLQTQRLSVGSSALFPVSGISYVRQRDTLIISLFDGSFHVIHNLSTEPSWIFQSFQERLASDELSGVSRAVFTQAEPGSIQFTDVNRISGMMSYDGSSAIMWVHEACRPSDFSYKHDARHNSMLVVAEMWEGLDDESNLENFAVTLNHTKSCLGKAPIHLLRPTFLFFRRNGKLTQIRPRVLDILRPHVVDDSVNIVVPSWTGELVPEMKQAFRKNLNRHLFGWDSLLSLRMRLAVADFCWKLSADDQDARLEYGQVAQQLLNSISYRVLRTIVRHLGAVHAIITPSEIPFVLRMVVQSLLPGCPADLSTEAQALSATVTANVPIDPQTSGVSHSLNEVCPACHIEVPLQDITSALCANGHTWARCSITSFILSTPMVRTCIGCSRKAFLPLSVSQKYPETPNWLPVAARSWVVEELLEAVHRCLFCGNSFVSIL